MVADPLFGVLPIGSWGFVMSLFCYAFRCVLSSFAIILKRKRELVVLLLLFCCCGCSAALPHDLLFNLIYVSQSS